MDLIYRAIYWVYIPALNLEPKKAYGHQDENRDQEAPFISVRTKFEEFEAMNAGQVNSYVPLELIWQETKP